MRSRFLLGFVACMLTASFLAPNQADAQQLRVEIENLGASDDFFLTPLWVGLHNGDFDLFDVGTAPTAGLEALAEDGMTAPLSSEFAGSGRLQSVAANPAGFGGAPVIDPGETAVTNITFQNPVNYQFFSFASMLIPTNDNFIGNEDAMAHRIFDTAGNFLGPQTIDITAADIYDAGTEENNVMGLPFAPGAAGTVATDTNLGVSLASAADLAPFVGTNTPASTIIGQVPSGTFARITITAVPEPGSMTALLVLGTCGLLRRRR